MVKGYRHGKRDGQTIARHRVRAEVALGHPLPPGAQVHHPDEDPWNPDARLVICEDAAYHNFLHSRMLVKHAGGDPNTQRQCSRCRELKPLAAFPEAKRVTTGRCFVGRLSYCRPCRATYLREYEAKHAARIRALLDLQKNSLRVGELF